MSDISKINVGGTEYNLKDSTARTEVQPIARGGTGATTAAGALSNLGISGIFSRVTYEVRNVSVAPGADSRQTFNVTRPGYTAIAVSAFYISFTRTPCIYRTYLSPDGEEAYVWFSNNSTTPISGTAQVEILYVKN